MPNLYRVRSVWTGFPGAPGVTTMYFLDMATCLDAVHTFWSAMVGKLPSDVHIQVQNFGDVIDSATGDLTDSWTADTLTSVAGTASDKYAAPVGSCVNWNTETVVGSRRLKGRTFLVPMGGDVYQTDGSIGGQDLTQIQGYADALISSESSSFVVWHRGTGSDGTFGLITSATVPDKAVVLRSRRA